MNFRLSDPSQAAGLVELLRYHGLEASDGDGTVTVSAPSGLDPDELRFVVRALALAAGTTVIAGDGDPDTP